jgi:hypothetical protein
VTGSRRRPAAVVAKAPLDDSAPGPGRVRCRQRLFVVTPRRCCSAPGVTMRSSAGMVTKASDRAAGQVTKRAARPARFRPGRRRGPSRARKLTGHLTRSRLSCGRIPFGNQAPRSGVVSPAGIVFSLKKNPETPTPNPACRCRWPDGQRRTPLPTGIRGWHGACPPPFVDSGARGSRIALRRAGRERSGSPGDGGGTEATKERR